MIVLKWYIFGVYNDFIVKGIKMAHEMRERRNMETPEQTEGRKMKERQNMDIAYYSQSTNKVEAY